MNHLFFFWSELELITFDVCISCTHYGWGHFNLMDELGRPSLILFLIMTLTDSNKPKLINAFTNLFRSFIYIFSWDRIIL